MLYARRFLDEYRGVSIDRPIFLLGNQGGGLTLVSRMLRRHPDVVSVTGDHRYWSGADEMQKVMMLRLPAGLRLGGRFICEDPPHDRFAPPRSWSYASDDLIDAYRKTEADCDDRAAQKLSFLIREALYRYGNGGQGKRFLDKSQVFTVKMSYVDALLRDTNPHFVLITRNPYAACFRAAMGKAGDMRRYAKFVSLDERVRVCAQHWSNAMCCALEDQKKVGAFKVMRFEDLLERPRESLHELCAFLDLSFSEDMIPRADHVIPFGSRYAQRWYPLRSEVNERYLVDVPGEYIEVIAERCQDIAEQFGYAPPKTNLFWSTG